MAQNFVACDRDQELLLPPSLRDWLPEGHLAWLSRLPPSPARSQAVSGLPERFMRAEMPQLDARPADLARINQRAAADLGPFDAIHVLACLIVTAGIFTRKEIYSELNDDSAAAMIVCIVIPRVRSSVR